MGAVLDLVAALAQPAGLGAATAVLLTVVVMRRGEARLRVPHGEGLAHADAFDAAAADELHRARRYGRPLALISLTTGRKEDIARLASELRATSRITDVVGFLGGSTIGALLPETAGHEAVGLVRRVADLVDADVASLAVVGIAGFPHDDVTWIGLRASAQYSARPLTDFRALRDGATALARDLSPAGTEPPFSASSAAHAADTAA